MPSHTLPHSAPALFSHVIADNAALPGCLVFKIGVPTGIRTPILSVKEWSPKPLDGGARRY